MISNYIEFKNGESIDIKNIDSFYMMFYSNNTVFVYWCEMNIFLKLYCKTKEEIRDIIINKILDRI